jgi:uncharacterized protein YbjT (DUF2867 family)
MNVCVAGATGLVGHLLIQELLVDQAVEQIHVISRQALSIAHTRLHSVVCGDFNKLLELPAIPASTFICCLGSTIKKAGSQSAFRQVDFTYVVAFAKLARKSKAQRFLVVTAMGAQANSKIFYNQVKGEVEQELRGMSFPELVILRPSLLLGDRPERRSVEVLLQRVAPLFNRVLVGPLRDYRAIPAVHVAKALKALALEKDLPNFQILSSGEITDTAFRFQLKTQAH